jgi:hypothetical protein
MKPTMDLEHTEQDILALGEVTDEALEAAAGATNDNAASYTLGSCTGISVCPGW